MIKVKEARKILGLEGIRDLNKILYKLKWMRGTPKGRFVDNLEMMQYTVNKKKGDKGHYVSLFITEKGMEELRKVIEQSNEKVV